MNAVPRTGPITRSDLESKFRELSGEVEGAKQSAQSYAVAAGAVVVVVAVGIAYFLGKRKGRKKSAVVEIRRL
jgi:hypothetical protein